MHCLELQHFCYILIALGYRDNHILLIFQLLLETITVLVIQSVNHIYHSYQNKDQQKRIVNKLDICEITKPQNYQDRRQPQYCQTG